MNISFRLGPIPVRAHAALILIAPLVAFPIHRTLLGIACFSGCFLTTIFVHELAHAAAGRALGAPTEVNLSLGASPVDTRLASLTALGRILVHLAGPVTSIVIGACACLLDHPSRIGVMAEGLRYLKWLNLGWGFLSLVPVLPLDGGHALAAVLDRVTGGVGEATVRWLSVGLAAAFGMTAICLKMVVCFLICALVFLQSAWGLRVAAAAEERKNREALLRTRVKAAFEALERGDASVAIDHCREVLTLSADAALRKDALRLLAYGYATTGAWPNLMQLLESDGWFALSDDELQKYEQAIRELGRPSDAHRIALLRRRPSPVG